MRAPVGVPHSLATHLTQRPSPLPLRAPHHPTPCQAGVADTKWAVEYEAPAADAFKLNNPDAEVFCANCNVILRASHLGGGGRGREEGEGSGGGKAMGGGGVPCANRNVILQVRGEWGAMGVHGLRLGWLECRIGGVAGLGAQTARPLVPAEFEGRPLLTHAPTDSFSTRAALPRCAQSPRRRWRRRASRTTAARATTRSSRRCRCALLGCSAVPGCCFALLGCARPRGVGGRLFAADTPAAAACRAARRRWQGPSCRTRARPTVARVP